jgi:mono/diheme cytochrome c family protein
MSGMPAWEYRLSDADLWATVAFLERCRHLTPAQFRAATVGEACVSAPARGLAPARTPIRPAARSPSPNTPAMPATCIPGVTGSQVHVGPPLAGIASRGLLAGQLANTPEHLACGSASRSGVDPNTAMPTLGVDERDARDIAAYLATLY